MNIERGDILYNREEKTALLIGSFEIKGGKLSYTYKEIGSSVNYFISKTTENKNVFNNFIRLGNVDDIDMNMDDILNKQFTSGDVSYNKYKFIKDIKFKFLNSL